MDYDIRGYDNIGELSTRNPNHICVVADFSSSTWNTNGTHTVFSVTGLARVRSWIYVKTQCVGASGDTVMMYGTSDYFIYNTWIGASGFAADNFLSFSASSGVNNQIVYSEGHADVQQLIGWRVTHDLVVASRNIGYTLSDGPMVSGQLEFHCVWEPLSQGATVTAGSGGSL